MTSIKINGSEAIVTLPKWAWAAAVTLAVGWAGWISLAQIMAGNKLSAIDAHMFNQQRSLDRLAQKTDRLAERMWREDN